MKPKALSVAITLALSSLAANTAFADDKATSLTDALSNSDIKYNFRYRLEGVDDSVNNDATASTLRSRITLTSQKYNNFQTQVELDNVSVIGEANHNDSANGMGDHAKVIDPEGSEINQAWVAYSGVSDTTVKVGRQRVVLDNQRFIGGVAWRQNEQTYDAAAIINKSIPDLTVVYGYVTNVNTIKGGNIDTDTQLLNVSYAGLPFGKITGYRYDIEVENDTTGIRFAGKTGIGSGKLLYTAEYATQEAHNGSDFEADYTHLMLGVKFGSVAVKLGQEVLGAEDATSAGFSTALATKHKFNGWADKFLGTPVGGLEDTYLAFIGKFGKVKVKAFVHDFESAEGNADLGEELNIAVATKVNKNLSLLVKYADYSAGDSGTDTQKLWLQAQYKF